MSVELAGKSSGSMLLIIVGVVGETSMRILGLTRFIVVKILRTVTNATFRGYKMYRHRRDDVMDVIEGRRD